MKTHILKVVQPFFSDIQNNLKTFELRRNDKDFQVGDLVILKEYDMLTNKFSGEEIKVIITYVLGNRAGLDDDFCMFSFKKIDESLASMTPEDWEKYFTKDTRPKDTRPKGWLNIEEHLPKMYAMDFAQGYSLFKVKYENGEIGESPVADHNTWYYRAKEAGITHWYNE